MNVVSLWLVSYRDSISIQNENETVLINRVEHRLLVKKS